MTALQEHAKRLADLIDDKIIIGDKITELLRRIERGELVEVKAQEVKPISDNGCQCPHCSQEFFYNSDTGEFGLRKITGRRKDNATKND